MTTTTRRRSHKPAPRPSALGLTDVQKVERQPRFGPGLKVRVSLNRLPAYLRVYELEVLDPNPDREVRTGQVDRETGNPLAYVKRVVQPKPAKSSILWCCLECLGQPELLQSEMITHMQEVHQIDTANVHGIKNLVLRTDAAGVCRPVFEWTIDGLTFWCYEPQEVKG